MSVPQRTRPFLYGSCQNFGDQAAQEQMLRQAHLRVRRHFERAHFHETQPAAAAFGREEFID